MTTHSDCVHHWTLERDKTTDVPAACQKCGLRRVFSGFKNMDRDVFRQSIKQSADKAKLKRVGLVLPGSPPLREDELAW